MAQRIHGHDVMQMMIDSKESYTKESLEQAIITKFGADARFHTCSAENMTARGIIEFLEKRGKFQAVGSGFSTDPAKMCSHDDHHHDHD